MNENKLWTRFKRILFAAIFVMGLSVAVVPDAAIVEARYLHPDNGYIMLHGTWQRRDGEIFHITDENFGMASYRIISVNRGDQYTVVYIVVNGRSRCNLTFNNGSSTYFMLENLDTGYTADFSKLSRD